MFKVKVITIGKCKENWLKEALSEYEKRLSHQLSIHWQEASSETQMRTWLEKESHFIALCIEGELLDSVSLSTKLFEYFEEKSGKLTFAIGGPEGLFEPLKQKAHWRLSLSPLTLTHQCTRLILLEQIYRSFEIRKNSPYHK